MLTLLTCLNFITPELLVFCDKFSPNFESRCVVLIIIINVITLAPASSDHERGLTPRCYPRQFASRDCRGWAAIFTHACIVADAAWSMLALQPLSPPAALETSLQLLAKGKARDTRVTFEHVSNQTLYACMHLHAPSP